MDWFGGVIVLVCVEQLHAGAWDGGVLLWMSLEQLQPVTVGWCCMQWVCLVECWCARCQHALAVHTLGPFSTSTATVARQQPGCCCMQRIWLFV